METIFTFSILTAIAVYIVLCKLDILKVVYYEVATDIIMTVLLALLYKGTYSGTMIAIISGLLLSIMLKATRVLFGYKKFNSQTRQWEYHAQ